MYHNKCDSTKSMGTYYWCVRIPQCGYMKHGLKHILFYIEKHPAHRAVCYNFLFVRDKPLGAPTFVKIVYFGNQFNTLFTTEMHFDMFQMPKWSNNVTQAVLKRALIWTTLWLHGDGYISFNHGIAAYISIYIHICIWIPHPLLKMPRYMMLW